MSTTEHSQTAVITFSSQTCWSSLKTLHDLPSSYSVNGAYFITGSVEHHSNEIFNHFQFTWTTIMPIIIVLCTILGNSLICLVALIDRHLRHRSNVFFISLSLTNILFSSTVMTFSIMYNLMKPENFSDSLVKVFLSLDKLFCTATILHLVVMAFDRFSHIKAPLKYSRRLKFRFLFLILSGLWFLSILIAILPIQLNWHTSDYRECISSTSSVVGPTTTTQIPESSTSQYIENKNCTYSSTHSSRLSSSSEMSTPSKAEFITPTNYIQINNFPCIHQIDFFYALTNAIFSFFIPLILMVTIYTRLFLLTKQHISRLNFYPNSTKCPHDLSFSETINGKQLFYTSQVSPNTMSKRKSLSSARTVYLDPNYDLTNSLRSSLTVSTDVLKPRPRLSRSHLGASLRSVQITSRHGCLSVTKKLSLYTAKPQPVLFHLRNIQLDESIACLAYVSL
ncbi:unnamed protein product [Heterobilharzia americana]|nr:unnamed protein product [Heterobilharzia americana]